MALKFSTAREIATEPPLIVIYAEPGVGKTTCISNLVKPDNPKEVLILDLDESTMVIERVCPEARVAKVKTFEDVELLLHMLQTDHEDVKDVKTLVIDTLTTGEDILLWDSMKSKGKKVPELSNYNERFAVLRQFIRDLKTIGKNIIAVCHEMEYELEEDNLMDLGTTTKITRKMPKLSGKLSNALVGSADIVLRLAIVEEVDPATQQRVQRRVFQTAKTDRVWAKDRTGSLPAVVPANLRKVLATWQKMSSKTNGKAPAVQQEPATTNGEVKADA